MMAETEGLSQFDAMGYCQDEETTEDERSDGDGETVHLNPQFVFQKMMRVASRMSHRDRQQQMVLLSLAMSAITKADAHSRSQTGTGNEIAKKAKGESLGLLSSATSGISKRWSPDDIALVKKLRVEKVSWGDICRHHFPGRTAQAIKKSYNYRLKKSNNTAEKEKLGGEESNGAEELEIALIGDDRDNELSQRDTDEDMLDASPKLSAFELKRRANIAENQALLDEIAPSMDTPRQPQKEKRKRLATPSTPPNPIRRSERKISARRTV